MEVIYDKDFIYIPKHLYKEALDGHFVKSKNAYRLPNNVYAWRQVAQIIPLTIECQDMIRNKELQLRRIKAFKKVGDVQGDVRLRPYQRVDVEFLSKLTNAGVFNQQRTGKTPTSLVTMSNEHRLLIVVPKSVIYQWEEEVKKWTNFTPIVCHGTKKKRQKLWTEWGTNDKTALIVSYGTIKNDIPLIPSVPYSMIVDEAHRLANYQTQQSQAIFKVGRKAWKRLALTGTPTQNKGDDIWGILHYLYPTKFKGYWQFVDRYFKTWQPPYKPSQEVSGYKAHRKQELTDMLECFSVQRKRSEVMKWIPKVQHQTHYVEMESKQRKNYEEMLDFFETEHVDAINVLSQLMRLNQITLDPSLLDLKGKSAKEEWLLDYLQDMKEPVVIFSKFTSYLKELAKKLKEPIGAIDGNVSNQDRKKVMQDFQNGKIRIILANIVSAGEGLTLDRASEVIFLDRHYNPAKNEQAQDRIIPTTQDSNQTVRIVDVVAKDSVDEKIQSILADKKDITEVINNYRNIKDFME